MTVLFPTTLVDGELNEKSAEKAIRRVLADWLSTGSIVEPDITVTVSDLYTQRAIVKYNITYWNTNIIEVFRKTVDELNSKCDTQETFACKLAAKDMDNDWNPMSAFAILSDPNKNPHFVNTCVNEYNEDEVVDNEELYAIAICSVKTDK